jgi:hypothetical protein
MSSKDKLIKKLKSNPKDFTCLIINVHKPHPSPIIKLYLIGQVIKKLKEEKLI